MDEQPTVPAIPKPPASSPKRLTRPREGRMFIGVCAGLASYFDIDPALLRAVFALSTLLFGFGIVVYLVLAVVMPNEEMADADPRSAAQATVDEATEELRRGIDRAVETVRGAFGKNTPPAAP